MGVMEVTRSTGFAKDLYSTEESDAAQLTDKQAKVDFLNKAINVTCIALNDKIDVSASKIVAGLEAEKTNAWLQKLHTAATTALAKSDEAVERVKNGETMTGAKKEKKEKPEKKEKKEDKEKKEEGGEEKKEEKEKPEKKEKEEKKDKKEKKEKNKEKEKEVTKEEKKEGEGGEKKEKKEKKE